MTMLIQFYLRSGKQKCLRPSKGISNKIDLGGKDVISQHRPIEWYYSRGNHKIFLHYFKGQGDVKLAKKYLSPFTGKKVHHLLLKL
jgi:hypothetical protein